MGASFSEKILKPITTLPLIKLELNTGLYFDHIA
jgi:hypothetical protein